MAQTKVKLISDGVIVQGNLHASHGITTAHIGEGSNLYYTDARVGSYLSTNSFATESYVGTQIANLVDSSPSALNTLNELAAALGDDANFSTTVTNSIALKAPLASPSFTGISTFAGRVNAGESFGALKDGADTVADGPFFRLTNAATTRQYLFQLDASNNIDYWYYNGSTWTQTISLLTNGGATFAGNVGIGTTPHATASLNITNTAQHIRLNNGSELGIITLDTDGKLDLWAHGTGETINFRTGTGSGAVTMSVVGSNVGIGVTPNSNYSKLQVKSPASSYGFDLVGRDAGSNGESQITFWNSNQTTQLAAIFNIADNLGFTTGTTERIRIDSSGNVGIGKTSGIDANLRVDANSATLTQEILKVKGGGSGGNYGFLVEANNGDDLFKVDTLTYNSFFPNGNVGIGSVSPIAKLDVRNNDGNASGLHIIADFNQNGGAGAQMILGYYANGSSPVGPLVYAANGMPQLINASGGIQFSNDLNFSSSFLYTFRDGVGINNPNSMSAAPNAGYTMCVGRSHDSGSGTSGSISAVGTIRASAFTTGINSTAGIGASNGDVNASETGPGYLNLSRDDTAGAQQIRFEKNGGLHSYIETTTSGLNIGNANVYLAKSSNQGQLFFGTSNNQYEIFGGGTFGYMGYNSGGYHRFLTNGSEVFRIKSSGELAIKNGANYSTTITYTNAWNASYQTLIPGAQLSPNSVYIITIRCNSFSTPPYYASTVFHIATSPGTNGGGGGNDNIAPTATHVTSNVYWKFRLSTIVNGRNGIEAYLVNGPNNPPSYPTMYITATKLMTIN